MSRRASAILLSCAGILACRGPVAPVGVILVSLDTLRADRLGIYGNADGLTPNLDAFAAESVVFDAAYAQSNETLYSHASLFTARYPSRLAPLDGDFRIPDAVPTVAATFTQAGWDTAGFVAGGHLARTFGLSAGFGTYDDSAAWGSLHDTGPRALRWLDARSGSSTPFFLFVHAYDTHDRYLKPTPFGYAFSDPTAQGLGATLVRQVGGASGTVGGMYSSSVDAVEQLTLDHPRFDRGRDIRRLDPTARPLTSEDVHQLAAAYDGAVAWADANFGLFLAGLDARGLLDRVVIVVVSDHGEELGEHGVFAHRYSLNDATTHVPWMVHLPKGTGRRVAGLAALVDVAPTLLDLAGLTGLDDGDGRSLRSVILGGPELARPFVVSEGALRLTSARGVHARLTFEGIRAENPMAASIFAVAPLDGVTAVATLPNESDAAELPELRAALVALRRPSP